MSSYPGNYHSGYHEEKSETHSSSSDPPQYTLKSLREFLSRRRFFIKYQFVSDDNNIIFLKVHMEAIGEDILIYFPSKYSVAKEIGTVPIIQISPYELSEHDLLSVHDEEEKESRENYKDFQIDDLKDKDSFTDDNFKPISIHGEDKDYKIKKSMALYTQQLNKFKLCTEHIKYKFAILTNKTICAINRHNETECYLLNTEGQNLINNIIDSKTDSVIPIQHEFYILVDLPSFYEKINHISADLIKIHRNFYAVLNKAHMKQTALAEHRFKNYQTMISKLIKDYTKNNKFLDLISSLCISLEKSVEQEDQLLQKLEILKVTNTASTMAEDKDRSFKVSNAEKELVKCRELKTKSIKLLQEIKTRYNAFILSYDSAITDTCIGLKNIEEGMKGLGIKL